MTSTPLHLVGDFLRDLLSQIPLSSVRIIFLAVPLCVLIWVLLLPRSETTAPQQNGRGGANLKVGAAIALLLQLAIYSLL